MKASLEMNFLKRLFGGGPAKNAAPSDSAQPTKPMAGSPGMAKMVPGPTKPAREVPPEDMTLIDPVAKDAWRAEQWRAQTAPPHERDKKK